MTKSLAVLILMLFTFSSVRSQIIISSPSDPTRLNDTILQLIKNAPKKDLVTVLGQMTFSDRVLRAENLVFHNNSELIFTNYDFPYIIIAVKNLKFNAPAIKSTVRFTDTVNVNRYVTYPPPRRLLGRLQRRRTSLGGYNGRPGVDATGDGQDGEIGSDGGSGMKGGSKNTPHVILMVDNINTDYGDITTFDWQVMTDGLQGGVGGNGGNGGKGGRGSSGHDSRSGIVDCRRGAGDGGNGGMGGRGGRGGDGGNGGTGGSIFLVGNNSVTDKLTYVQFKTAGGKGGAPGKPGKPGEGGEGGGGGTGSTFCKSGTNGSKGAVPVPSDNGTGKIGSKGNDGEVKIMNTSLNNIL